MSITETIGMILPANMTLWRSQGSGLNGRLLMGQLIQMRNRGLIEFWSDEDEMGSFWVIRPKLSSF